MRKSRLPSRPLRLAARAVLSLLAASTAWGIDEAADSAKPASGPDWPALLGAQYTFVVQHQTPLHSPYAGSTSLDATGDTQPTHTLGMYFGWAPLHWAQLYLDVEKFMGAGVSHATGLGGLTNGDVVREGASGLKKEFYIARSYLRLVLPLSSDLVTVPRAQDQIPHSEAATHLEFKFGRLAVNDDLDKNRYAGSTRTQFMNWSLWQNTAWDYAANTRGYTDGLVLGYVSTAWSLKYGLYRMPVFANGQTLESSLRIARGENLELTLSPWSSGTVVRLLGFRNRANMGDYREALRVAAATGTVPDIAADDQPGRHKVGFGINAEQPLADEGESGLFARFGWNDGRTESFAFTEVDRDLSLGGQLALGRWHRPQDRLAIAIVTEGLSAPHRDYLAAGGSGFLLGDGRLNYAPEQIVEAYYRWQFDASLARFPWHLQLSPDVQYVRHPGFNQDRGPVEFWALRLHLEY